MADPLPIPPETPEDEPRDAILDRVEALFMRIGVRSVTMDDVAGALGVSKKTLYKHFRNKGDLVEQTMRRHFRHESCRLEDIRGSSENAIDALLQTSEHIARTLAGLNPAVLHDVRKYYPETWALFEDHKHDYVTGYVADNLRRGMAEGLYRHDLDPDILARIYTGRMDLFFDARLFPPERYRLVDVYAEFLDYHVRGIASPAGVAYLESRDGIRRLFRTDPA